MSTPSRSAEIARDARGADALGDVPEAAEDLRQRLAARERQADLAVARQIAGAGQHEIAEPGQPGERQRVAAHPLREPAHLGEAARDQRGARVVAEAEPVAAADRDRDDVLQRAAHADAGDVAARVDAEAIAAEAALHGRADAPDRVDATTSAAGSPRAISSAKLGPGQHADARARQARARSPRPSSRRVRGSSPFDAQTTIGAPPARRRRRRRAQRRRDGRRRHGDDQHVAAGHGAADVARHRDLGGQRESPATERRLARSRASASAAARSISHSVTSCPCRAAIAGEHAAPRAAAQDGDGVTSSTTHVPATRTRLRPAFLAANSARSAAASTSAGSAPSSGNDATPSEIVSLPLGCVLPNSNGNSATCAQIRSATSFAARLADVEQDDRELLAAVARDDVVGAPAVLQDLRHAAQRVVAGQVAVAVVVALEVIDVDHQHRQRQPGAVAALHLQRQPLAEVAVVVEAGEAVGDRQLGEARVQRLELARALDDLLLQRRVQRRQLGVLASAARAAARRARARGGSATGSSGS